MPKLINRNVFIGEHGRRTSIKLEGASWDAVREICMREDTSLASLIGRIDASRVGKGTLTSEVRAFIITYFMQAATERGHAAANHGSLNFHEE